MGKPAYWFLNELIVDLRPTPTAFDLLDPELLLGTQIAFSYVLDGGALVVLHRLAGIAMSSRIAPPQDR